MDAPLSQTMWQLDYDDTHIDVKWTGEKDPVCQYCGKPIVGWMLKKMKITNIPGYNGHAMDIECICPDCRALFIFGIAISEKDFNAIKCIEIPA